VQQLRADTGMDLFWSLAHQVFDLELPLGDAAASYEAMDERRAIKALLRP
jgi:hypothetical protein